MSDLNIAANIAKQLKDIGITAAPTPAEYDALDLGITSRGLKRQYGTYDIAMKEVMKFVNADSVEITEEEWEEGITDWQQDMNDEADI